MELGAQSRDLEDAKLFSNHHDTEVSHTHVCAHRRADRVGCSDFSLPTHSMTHSHLDSTRLWPPHHWSSLHLCSAQRLVQLSLVLPTGPKCVLPLPLHSLHLCSTRTLSFKAEWALESMSPENRGQVQLTVLTSMRPSFHFSYLNFLSALISSPPYFILS